MLIRLFAADIEIHTYKHISIQSKLRVFPRSKSFYKIFVIIYKYVSKVPSYCAVVCDSCEI